MKKKPKTTGVKKAPAKNARDQLLLMPAEDADDVVRVGPDYLDGIQVTRAEYFAQTTKPSMTFNLHKIYFNKACLKRFPNVDYVLFGFDENRKILTIHPSSEDDWDAHKWCVTKEGERNPKTISGRDFVFMIMDKLEWNFDYRYKLLGRFMCCGDEYFFEFDLASPMAYKRELREDENPRSARLPLFPAEWKNRFGVPLAEHRKRLQVRTFNLKRAV